MSHAARRRTWLITLIFCFAPSCFAQNQSMRPAIGVENPVEELAAALIAAKSEAERDSLLIAKRELLTTELAQALIRQGGRLRTQGTFSQAVAPQALAIFQLARRIAEQLGDQAGIATALINLGDVHRNQGNRSLALEHYRKSLALREALGDQAGIASALLVIGFVYSAQGDFALALEHYQKSLAISETRGDWTAVAWAQGYVGDAYRLQKNYSAALEAYQKALTLFEAAVNKARMAYILTNIGLAYTAQGKAGPALEAYQRSLTLSEELRDKRGMAEALQSIGGIHLNQKNNGLALEAYQKALALWEALGNKGEMASKLNLIGVGYLLQEPSLARELFQKSLSLTEAAGDKKLMAETLLRIGQSYHRQGDISLALEYYQKSSALSEALGDQAGMAQSHRQAGIMQTMQGAFNQALEHYQKALMIHESSGNKSEIAFIFHHLGFLYASQGNHSSALEYYHKALTIREALNDKEGMAVELHSIGESHLALRNFDLAVASLRRAIMLREAIGNQIGTSELLSDIGKVYGNQRRFDEAREYFQKNLALSERFGGKVETIHALLDLGDHYRMKGNYNYAFALENYQKSLALSEALGFTWLIADTLLRIGWLHSSNSNYTEAARVYERAAELYQAWGPAKVWLAQANVGDAYRALGQFDQAEAAYHKAITAIETMRVEVVGDEQESQRFFENKTSPYFGMVKLLVAQNKTRDAFAYVERAKARTLLDALRSGRANIVKAMTAQEQAQEQSLRSELVSLNSQITSETRRPQPDQTRLAELRAGQQKARQSYEAFQASLYLAHPELRAKRGEAPPLELAEAADLLADGKKALLEYIVTAEQSYLFALTKEGAGNQSAVEVKIYPLPIKAEDLTERAEQFRRQLSKRDPGFADSARAFYDLLLKPAAAQLQGKTHLVIVPDGPLWELPFQSLQSAPNRYLIEDHAVSYVPSLTVLREMIKSRRKQATRAASLLAFGNPALGQQTVARARTVMMDEKFEPLPEAERQVNALARLYGARRSKVYVGAEAREERAKAEAGNHRILHLATHGVFNDASPMYSHVLLAQTEEQGKEASEDGLLEAWELMKLELNADLVVLSACETARGRVGAGEGVIGLTWALFVAGCPRTVVSQWKVESASTTELMVEFHRQLKSRMQKPSAKLGAAQALRAAALKMLRGGQYRHPFWWAGFVVVGDGF